MPDREKVKKGFERCLSGKMPFGCGKCPYFGYEEYNDAWSCRLSLMRDALELLKEQEAQKFFVDESGKITPLPVVVRCKDCKHNARCEIAFGCNGNREWYCADGERRADDGQG